MKNKLYICKDYHIQPSELMQLPYYEYELMLEEIKVINKQQEQDNENHQKQYEQMSKGMNPGSMMRNVSNTMNNMSMPKISVPKI